MAKKKTFAGLVCARCEGVWDRIYDKAGKQVIPDPHLCKACTASFKRWWRAGAKARH